MSVPPATATDEPRVHQLLALALALGIATEYWDVRGNRHHAGVDALLGAIAAMGLDADGLDAVPGLLRDQDEQRLAAVTDPVLVAWAGRPFRFDVRLPDAAPVGTVEVVAELEGGGVEHHLGSVDLASAPTREEARGSGRLRVVTVDLGPVDLPVGYHAMRLDGPGLPAGRGSCALFSAPVTGETLDPLDRLWGVFTPAYGLPGGRGLGAHVGDLGTLAARLDLRGGKIIGTLPLLAAWLGAPFDPSPYAPVSRRFWNELYIDLESLPELASSAEAAANLDGLRSIGHAANVKGRHFDYRHQHGYVRGVLEQVVAARDDWAPGHGADLDRFLEHHPDVTDYARFRAHASACARKRA